jgi:uncharacterized protein (DUF849 family)
VLQACLNGSRVAGVPLTPAALASAARASVAAGAVDLHLHPKDAPGRDSLKRSIVDVAVRAVRWAVPGVPVGVTTAAWALGSWEMIPQWTVRPDHASVNWREERAEEVAAALLAAGIAVHAGSAVLLHGEEELTWPVLRLARSHGFDARIGLEDTLTLPDGRPTPDNAALVEAALAIPTRPWAGRSRHDPGDHDRAKW